MKEKQKSIANASAEYSRIHSLLEVLIDGETYLWHELEAFFDVKMDTRGRAIFRRVVLNAGRLYSPLAHPSRGLGIVMGEGNTVADIVEDKQRRVHNATKRVVGTINSALNYSGVPANDVKYMRQLRSQNQLLLNNYRLKPLKRVMPNIRLSDGMDMPINDS